MTEARHGSTLEAVEESSAPVVAPAAASAGEDTYAMPATQGQVRFWSLDSLHPGNPALNMPLMWQCTGPLNVDLLRAAFAQCVTRHEALRTTFAVIDGKLSQVIHPLSSPAAAVPILVEDLTSLTGEAQRLEADTRTREHAAYRFNLSTGPLLTLRLLKLGPQNHLLLVSMHHIICDGISNGILMRDMEAFYEAGLHNSSARLPELPIQFADYAVWHEDWRHTEEHSASLEFWRNTLGQGFSPIRLPHDADAHAALPPHLAGSTGAIDTLLVPPDLTARAHAFCIREGVTLNVLLFSIFCALLNRITGQRDLTIGSPCANRNEDTEELIGLFMNIQVLRVTLEEHSSFRDLLRQVNTWTLAATEHQALMFEDLVHDPFFGGESALEIPIFFLYQKSFMLTKRMESAEGSLQIVPLRSESPGAVFEVMFAVVDREEEGPRLQLEYNPQFFKSSTIKNYLRVFVNLLDSAMTNADVPVAQLNLLSPSAREALLQAETRSKVDFGPFEAVHDAFLRRAAAAPEAVALQCAGVRWTNAQLAARAQQIASTVTLHGLQSESLVAIGMRRSPDMVAAMLGVMMAGGAYVPLDLRYPRERMEHVLADSAAAFLLTNVDLTVSSSAQQIRLDQIPAPPQPPAGSPTSACLPSSLAYVIYTSGSTGKPKGAAIEHGALMNLLRSMERAPGLTAEDTLVAVTTLAFDISAMELLLPLLTGAKLVIASEEEAGDPTRMLALLRETSATILQATPGAWRVLLDTNGPQQLPLRALCGGEAMSRDLADRLLAGTREAWNLYGPTETTIWSSATRVTPGRSAPRIGAPIANTQFYVLDDHLQPLPAGIDGELYIGGAGLARGYWNRPELTAASFVTNPFGDGRLYRTGDIARRHEDGSLQLLGRADFQVKVRGYRIELGEIESELMRHPGIREAVVVHHVRAEEAGHAGVARLVAYVVAAPGAQSTAAPALIEDLQTTLSRAIPDYMMPNAFMVLDALPRTPNGKLDRNALPDVFDRAGNSGIRQSVDHAADFIKPRDILERQLAEMWQTTLRIPRISVRASFFSLGVGSLAALRLITRMNRVYGLDLGLASLISASSIESIAGLIRNRIKSEVTSCIVPLKPEGTRPPLFMIHGVGGNVINLYGLATRIDAAQPVYGIQSQALLAGQPALLRLEDMAAYYIREMRSVQPAGPYHLLGYSFGGTVAAEMAQQLRAAGERVAWLGMLDSRTRDFEHQLRKSVTLQDRVDRRLERARRNTAKLGFAERFRYLSNKLATRAIRFTSFFAGAYGMRKLPAFMKSPWDINHAAIERYKLKSYPGTLVLFRATEQEFAGGDEDLGWRNIFTGGVEIHEIEGDHERIFLEPSIDSLAQQLRKTLAESSE